MPEPGGRPRRFPRPAPNAGRRGGRGNSPCLSRRRAPGPGPDTDRNPGERRATRPSTTAFEPPSRSSGKGGSGRRIRRLIPPWKRRPGRLRRRGRQAGLAKIPLRAGSRRLFCRPRAGEDAPAIRRKDDKSIRTAAPAAAAAKAGAKAAAVLISAGLLNLMQIFVGLPEGKCPGRKAPIPGRRRSRRSPGVRAPWPARRSVFRARARSG